MGALVFLDFETTGMSPESDVITDIGLLRVAPDGGRETWGQLVNPGMRIPPAVTALTGISDAMVSGAPDFASVAGELVRRCDGALIVAHNARFDIGFLTAGLRRCGVTRRTPHVCSVRVARKLLPDLKSRSLDALARHFGLRFAGERHRALPDAEMLCRLWFAMRDAAGAEAFDKAVAKLVADGPAGYAAAAPGGSSPLPEPWPYAGPVVMRSTRREGEWHVFDGWRHLGSVADEGRIPDILDAGKNAPFVYATYRRIVVALTTPGVEIRPLP